LALDAGGFRLPTHVRFAATRKAVMMARMKGRGDGETHDAEHSNGVTPQSTCESDGHGALQVYIVPDQSS
jgi:hypothetical protein